VFLGPALQGLPLDTGVSLVRHRLAGRTLLWIDQASGGVLLLFGMAAFAAAMVEIAS